MASKTKYDRQLRLWGDSGQFKLRTSHVVCFGLQSLSNEVLKNLILSGVGRISVVDSQNHPNAINFFNTNPTISFIQSLASLNPDVTITEFESENDFFASYSINAESAELVLSSQFSPTENFKLINRFPIKTKFVFVNCVGFIASIRLFMSQPHIVYQLRPSVEEDFSGNLRLANPFRELSEIADSFSIQELSDVEFCHVPFIVLLLLARVEASRTSELDHDAVTLKNILLEWKGMRPRLVSLNFEEAIKHVFMATRAKNVSDETIEVLHTEIEGNSQFNRCMKAIRLFHNNTGELPVSGELPDMISDTQSFIRLQKIYKKKAEEDVEKVLVYVKNDSENDDELQMTEREYVQAICKHLHEMRVMKYNKDICKIDKDLEEMENTDPESLLQWYIALNYQNKSNVDPKIHAEIERYRGSPINAVTSVIGGVAAQETIKLLSGQFLPIDNTFIYNGVFGRSQTISLY